MTHNLQQTIPAGFDSESWISELADISELCFWETNSDYNLTFCSPTVLNVLGIPESIVLGRSITEIAIPSERPKIEHVIRQSLSTGKPFRRINIQVQTQDGKPRVHEVSGFPIRDCDGRLIGIRGVSRDITSDIKVKESLTSETENAKRESTWKSEFLAMISHDLRTPLAGIKGVLTLLMDTPLNPDQHDYVSLLRRATEDISLLVDNLLDHARIEAGSIMIHQRLSGWKQVLLEIRELLRIKSSSKNVRIQLDFDANIPEEFQIDQTLFRRIMLNLMNNAVVYTTPGDAVIVSVRRPNPDKIEFSVTDHGPGIPKNKLSELFKPFRRMTKQVVSGNGLGLAIVVKLADSLGGSVAVESDENCGATFRVCLPFVR